MLELFLDYALDLNRSRQFELEYIYITKIAYTIYFVKSF